MSLGDLFGGLGSIGDLGGMAKSVGEAMTETKAIALESVRLQSEMVLLLQNQNEILKRIHECMQATNPWPAVANRPLRQIAER